MSKKISIIIPVKNEEKYISECIKSIIVFDYPKDLLEVIFVDGMSEDKTVEIIESYIKKYPYIKILNNIMKIVPISMNMAIKASTGDYICRLDAHASYPIDYISKLFYWSEKLNADNVGAVCITDVKNKNLISNAIKKVLSHKLGVGNSDFRIGSDEIKEVDTVPFGFFKKTVFNKYGLYDERLTRNQDIELNKRIKNNGGKIYLIPEVKCIYYSRENFLELAKNNYNNGKWNILTAYYTKALSSLSLRHFVPMLYMLGLIIPLLLSLLINNNFVYIFISLLIIHFMSLSIMSFKINDSSTSFINILKSFYTLHFSYGFGSLKGCIDIVLRNNLK